MDSILTLFKLFISFFKIGMFSIGGGMAMLPLIEKELILENKFIDYNQFLDLLSISQSSPGPIAINSATFIGFKVNLIYGSIIATLGIVLPSIIFINLISPYLQKHFNHPKMKNLFKSLRPITIGFILSAAILVAQKTIIDIKSIMIVLISFYSLLKFKIHPIKLILFFGILEIIIKRLPF